MADRRAPVRTAHACRLKVSRAAHGGTAGPHYVIYVFTKEQLETVDHEERTHRPGELCRHEQHSEAFIRLFQHLL